MKFLKSFLFGSATSAYQTEGQSNLTDWHDWELVPGHIVDNSNSMIAADSWNKWQDDIKILKETHQNAYRFSIEWAKIEPIEGKFDQTAINHYRDILTELKKQNITALVTLHHFTNPAWLGKIGGFANPESIKYFTRYATKIIKELGDLTELWTTFNETKVLIMKGNLQTEWFPGKFNPWRAFKMYKNMIKAHNSAYVAIKKLGNYKVGIVQNISAYAPKKPGFLNNILVNIARYFDTAIFIKPTVKYMDFLGINYYMKFALQAKVPFLSHPNTLKNDYGWSINQEGLYQVIMENTKWGKPIYITENGVADEKDLIRPDFIKQALENIDQAITGGAPVEGYFYWSLLDNFEFASGYTMKFGLATIDRKIRPSAFVYRDLIDKVSQPD